MIVATTVPILLIVSFFIKKLEKDMASGGVKRIKERVSLSERETLSFRGSWHEKDKNKENAADNLRKDMHFIWQIRSILQNRLSGMVVTQL